MEALWIALAGACGALCRWQVGRALDVDRFPYGTLTVNILGSFLIAILIELSVAERLPPSVKAPLTTGFLGAFTTFSTFSYDTLSLLQDDRPGLALANVLLNVGLGLMAAYGGLLLARAL